MEGQEELLVFDIEDLINGIDGALGLFLGWSILYLGKSKFNYSIQNLFLVTETYNTLPDFYHYLAFKSKKRQK